MWRRSVTGVRWLGAAIAVQSLLWAGAGSGPQAPHVRNFGQVNGTLFRGAEPSAAGLEELGAMGVKLVIDLRETGAGTRSEQAELERLRIKYVNVPFNAWAAPKPDQIRQVLGLIQEAGKDPVFVHCRRGKDRTGTVVACYRIQHDGWDNERALREAQEYGMSVAERGMRAFVLHFKPLPALFPAPVAP